MLSVVYIIKKRREKSDMIDYVIVLKKKKKKEKKKSYLDQSCDCGLPASSELDVRCLVWCT